MYAKAPIGEDLISVDSDNMEWERYPIRDGDTKVPSLSYKV